MRTVEFYGKNVDAAIAKGLAQLGLTQDQVTVKVLDEGSHGVFGLFAKMARVAITADLPEEPAAQEPAEAEEEPAPAPVKEEAAAEPEEPAFEQTIAPEDLDESGKRVMVFLTETARLMGVKDPGIAMARTEDDGLKVRVEGPHMGALIGHRGETLDALQLLTGLVANQHHDDETKSGYCHVTLDIGGYRTKREDTLRALALRLADKARRSGRSVSLEPMNSYERRVIHSVLHDAAGITTHSEGAEPYRHVVISPNK